MKRIYKNKIYLDIDKQYKMCTVWTYNGILPIKFTDLNDLTDKIYNLCVVRYISNTTGFSEEIQETEIFLSDWFGCPLKDFLNRRDVETKKCELYNNKDIYLNCEKQRTIVY